MDFLRTRRELRVLSETTHSPFLFQSSTAITRTGPSDEQRPPFEPGTLLHEGRFAIKEVIGMGGEGVVYKAWDRALEQYVALKTLHVTDASHIPTLKREFRFLRGLSHPCLVQLHELVVDLQLSFFTMALVEGCHFLHATIDENALRSLLVQLSDVVAFLHSTGRVHRDIKATNILVRRDGSLVLLDFGIGLNLKRPESELKGPTGTPRYMAPELLLDRPASQESDAYSIGVLLYEALTGAHPSPTGRTEISLNMARRPSVLLPDVPADLDTLCYELLEPKPDQRATVQTIIATLGHFDERASRPFIQLVHERESFRGRSYELSRLENTFLRMQQAYAPVVALIEAESGLGKTAFVEQFLSEKEGVVILRSKCSEHELVAHKAIDGIIDDLIDHLLTLDQEDLKEIIPEEEAGILVQLFPELRRLPSLEDAPTISPPLSEYRAMRIRAYLALAGVLGRLSDGCDLIIFVDDLQWGDVDSGRLLREVFAGPERPHCLLILAYRSEEQDQSDCIKELLDGPGGARSELQTIHIQLEPLSIGDSRALVEHLTRDLNLTDQEVETIVAEAEGSPLLLTELVSHRLDPSVESGHTPVGIEGIVEHRVGKLSEDMREAFYLICCAGVPLSLSLIFATTQCTSVDVLSGLTHGRLAHSRKGGQAIEVFHDSIREAVMRRLGATVPRYHAVLAQALAGRGGDAAEIARHFFAGGDPRQGSLWAETAAEQSNRSFALARAIELFKLALSATEISAERQINLTRRLALTYAAFGRGADAAPIFWALSEKMSKPVATELRTQAASHFLICGDADRGMAALARVHKAVGLSWPRSHKEALRFFVWERLRLRLALKSPMTEATEFSVQRRAQLDACRAALHLGFVSILHARGSSARYLRLAHRSGDRDALAVGYGMEAIYRATAGSTQKVAVQGLIQKAKGFLGAHPGVYNRAFGYYVEGQCHYLVGEIKQSIIYYEKAEQGFLAEGRNVSWELNSARVMFSQALSLLGRLDEWNKRLSAWSSDAEERGDMCLLSATHIGLGRLEVLLRDNADQARSWVLEGRRRFSAPAGGTHYFAAQFALAFIDSYDGRPHEVRNRMKRVRKEMSSTHMTRVQIPRAHLAIQDAFSCLALALSHCGTREQTSFLCKARALAHRLEQEEAAWTDAFALQIRALCDLQTAPNERALQDLKRAEQLFSVLDLGLFRAAVTRQIGELVAGDEGRQRVDEADRHFLALGVQRPAQAAGAFSPRIKVG